MNPSKLDVYAQEVRTSLATLKTRIGRLSSNVHQVHANLSQVDTLEDGHRAQLDQIKQEITVINGQLSEIGTVPVPATAGVAEPAALDPADAEATQEEIDAAEARRVDKEKEASEVETIPAAEAAHA